MGSLKQRPDSRITPLMLATLANCPRRYWIEYIKDFRMAGYRPSPWPPSLKQLIQILLETRDNDYAAGLVDEEVMLGNIKASALRWMSAVWDAGAERLVGEQRAALNDQLQEMMKEALRIEEHHYKVYKAADEIIDDAGLVIEARLPTWGKKGPGRKGLWNFTARIDGIILQHDDGPALIVRRLTSSSNPADVISEMRERMSWLGLVWLASQHVRERKIGSVIFDVVRTKAPATPSTVKCRKCHGSGENKPEKDGEAGGKCQACSGTGVGGLSKAACDTTHEIFFNAIAAMKHLPYEAEYKKHEEQLNRLRSRGDTFSYRGFYQFDWADVEEWVHDTVETLNRLRYYKRRNYWPRNPAACEKTKCPYRRPCSRNNSGDVAWFKIIGDPYPGIM